MQLFCCLECECTGGYFGNTIYKVVKLLLAATDLVNTAAAAVTSTVIIWLKYNC